MKNFLFSAIALTAFVAPGLASADDVSDRTQAIQLCRAELTAQSGATTDQLRLDQVRVRPHTVRVDFDLWRNGDLQNVRCEVTRGQELSIAAITPAVQTASVPAQAASN